MKMQLSVLKKITIGLWMVALFAVANVAAPIEEGRHEDHEQLREMLKKITTAFNTRDLDSITSLVDEKVAIISVDQRKCVGLEAFKAYVNSLFSGDNPLLKSIVFKPESDQLTTFLEDNVGISHGISTDTYSFINGETRVMKTRWSAITHKNDGSWKLTCLHMGVNLFDNPVLEVAKKFLYWIAAIALILGFFLGFLLARKFGAKK
jgi:hypothetical protein